MWLWTMKPLSPVSSAVKRNNAKGFITYGTSMAGTITITAIPLRVISKFLCIAFKFNLTGLKLPVSNTEYQYIYSAAHIKELHECIKLMLASLTHRATYSNLL